MRPNCLKYRQGGPLCWVFFFFCSVEIRSGQRGGTRQKRREEEEEEGRGELLLHFLFFFLMWVALVAVLIQP